MKIAVISDIHSNLEALSTALRTIVEQEVDEIFCLGDVVGYGPDPAECVELVRKVCKVCLRGNHDEAEQLYRKSLELDPCNAGYIGNFASFLTNARGDHEEAEQFHRKALDCDSNNATHAGNYAAFLLARGRRTVARVDPDRTGDRAPRTGGADRADTDQSRAAGRFDRRSVILRDDPSGARFAGRGRGYPLGTPCHRIVWSRMLRIAAILAASGLG